VLFVSNDSSDEEFDSFFQTMPDWYTFPRDFEGFQRRQQLCAQLQLKHFPKIIVLSALGDIVNTRGVEMIEVEDPKFLAFPWVLQFSALTNASYDDDDKDAD
jgi:hypothetical protein